MWSTIASFLLGVFGWLSTALFVEPLRNFCNLRGRIQEEITYIANIRTDKEDRERRETAIDTLRRLGAQISATDISASPLLRWYLKYTKYDLIKTRDGLIGLSNKLGSEEQAIHKDLVQVGLKLPRDYADADIEKIKNKVALND